jgi:multidrug transporter EmrE-like cation transporter
MRPVAWASILTGVTLNAVAQILLKMAVSKRGEIALRPRALFQAGYHLALNPWLWAGILCYVVSLCVWLIALSRVSVNVAYPMLSLGYVMAAVLAWIVFGERLNPIQMIGIAVIILGVYMLTRTSA